MSRKIVVHYWVKDTWPYSIDEKPDGAKPGSIEVTLDEIFKRDGKHYYRLQSGHGVWTDLLVREEWLWNFPS